MRYGVTAPGNSSERYTDQSMIDVKMAKNIILKVKKLQNIIS